MAPHQHLLSFLCETTSMLQNLLLLEGLFPQIWQCLSNTKWCVGYITFWCQVCIPAKWQPHLLLFFFYHIISQIWKIMFATDFTSSECFLSAFYCVKQRPGKPESIYFEVMKFFMVTLTTKATAILGALRTFVCPLLWEWKVNLYRTRSHLVWDSTLSEYKCRLNWGENVDK